MTSSDVTNVKSQIVCCFQNSSTIVAQANTTCLEIFNTVTHRIHSQAIVLVTMLSQQPEYQLLAL